MLHGNRSNATTTNTCSCTGGTCGCGCGGWIIITSKTNYSTSDYRSTNLRDDIAAIERMARRVTLYQKHIPPRFKNQRRAFHHKPAAYRRGAY